MAVRDFNGSSDVVTVPAPAYFSGPFTWVGILERDGTGAWSTPFSIGNPSNNSSWSINFIDTGGLQWQSAVNSSFANETTHNYDVTTWGLFAVTYDGTLSDYQFRHFDGSTAFHGSDNASTNETTDPHDWVSAGGAVLQLGRWNASFNYFNGKMAMQAINIGTQLDSTALAALQGGDRDDYVAAGFDHLWEFNQASTSTAVEDYIGSLDQTAISGTSVVVGDDPPSSIYTFSGGGDPGGSGSVIRPGRHRGRYPARDVDWF